ncbi:MAG: hypothetical protein VYA84_11010 [Planctomycetota bacterium]|nr:hypothetical protein [Planctomycetota bacterium]
MVSFLESIEPFALLLAMLPLIGYLALISGIRLSGRPLITTGGRDTAALAMAISGLLAVGPAELFFPTAAATLFGPIVWLALAAFYVLSVALIILSSKPKLVVIGRTPEEMYEALLAAAREIDPKAKGEPQTLQVLLPNLRIRLRLDGNRVTDHTQVVSFEPNISLRFWSTLLGNLRFQIRQQPGPEPHRGFGMLLTALLLAAILTWQSFSKHDLVVEGFRDWLWR